MKAINTGNDYQIYDDSVQLYNLLPAHTYEVQYAQMRGFWLEKHDDIVVTEKIYGSLQKKVIKVLHTYADFTRSLGVILSGDKGIGKSLFSKLLAQESVKQGLPVILVNDYTPGIASFLDSISQEVMILFDEFDKTFACTGNCNPQTEMLTLFDGMSMNKKLFVITCNDIKQLNEFLVNRPGRFHYHFRFDYPNEEEIREFLVDQIGESPEIDNVVNFSQKVKLNYDCLRAIAYELKDGSLFNDIINDLNILDVDIPRYNLILHYSDGTTLKSVEPEKFDLFRSDNCHAYFSVGWFDGLKVTFDPTDSIYDYTKGGNIILGEYLTLEYDKGLNDPDEPDLYNEYQTYTAKTPAYLQIKAIDNNNYRYLV